MLSVMEAIKQRRSIRGFKPDAVPEEFIIEMLEAARLAPSGSNRQPWRFIIVTDSEEKARLSKICFDQAFIKQAPVVFICCTDLTVYSQAQRKLRSQEMVDSGVSQTLSGRFADPAFREMMLSIPDTDLKIYLQMAVANTYIAVEHMVLMATALGLGSCWIGAIGEEGELNKMFNLPPTMVPVAVLPIGYPAQNPPPRTRVALSSILLRPLPVHSPVIPRCYTIQPACGEAS
jgi:nitroreductase